MTAFDALPPWVNREAWETFRQYRTELGAPMTELGEKLLLADLRAHAGDDPAKQEAVIGQTLRTCRWTGLFPLRADPGSERTTTPRRRPRGPVGAPLPHWVDPHQWARFRAYRAEIGSPMTEDSERLLLGDLRSIAGDDRKLQAAVIAQTIKTGRWLGLFPVAHSAPVQRLAQYTGNARHWVRLQALALDPSVGIAEIRVLAAICKRIDDEGAPVEIGWKTFASATGLSRSTVARGLRELKRRGVVRSECYPPGTAARYWIAEPAGI